MIQSLKQCRRRDGEAPRCPGEVKNTEYHLYNNGRFASADDLSKGRMLSINLSYVLKGFKPRTVDW
jgi:hypothetical protein